MSLLTRIFILRLYPIIKESSNTSYSWVCPDKEVMCIRTGILRNIPDLYFYYSIKNINLHNFKTLDVCKNSSGTSWLTPPTRM